MKTRDFINRIDFFKEKDFIARGSGRHLMMLKPLTEDVILQVEADLHRKFGCFNLSFRLGVRFEVINREFYKLANNQYGVESRPYDFTYWEYMRNVPKRMEGPHQWDFQGNEAEINEVVKLAQRFLAEQAWPWLERISDPQSTLDLMAPKHIKPPLDWVVSIESYLLAKNYGLKLPERAIEGIFWCIKQKEIGMTVCQRLVDRDDLKNEL